MLKLKHKIKAPHFFGALFFSSKKEPGFSLFELLIALGLLTVIATLTITNTSFLNRFILQTEVEKLFSHCMHQQYKALMSGSNQTITFNPKQQIYTVGNQTYKLPTTIEFAMPGGAKGPPSKPTKKITKPITWKNNTLICHTSGIMQSGTVYLTNKRKTQGWAISNGVGTVSFLRKYRYDGKWHYIP